MTAAAPRLRGADPPFADPTRDHGTPMEGYYWRLVDPAGGRVVVALCGVCAGAHGRWGLVGLAAHPQGAARHAFAAPASGDRSGFGARAGTAFECDRERLRVDLDDGWALDVAVADPLPWPRGALGAMGLGQLVPGLAQYWQPVLLGGRARGRATIGGERVDVDGWSAYAERNWGAGFPGDWWWGHAAAFGAGDAAGRSARAGEVAVAFAGGRIALLGTSIAPTALALRLGGRVLRLAPPLGRARVAADGRAWRVRARSGRLRVELDAEADGAPHLLPVPDVARGGAELRALQHLAGRLRLRVRRGRRTLFEGESPLAGLERGSAAPPPDGTAAIRSLAVRAGTVQRCG